MQQLRSKWSTAAVVGGAIAFGLLAWQRRPNDDLRGEVALITGGSCGLGFLIARELGRSRSAWARCHLRITQGTPKLNPPSARNHAPWQRD